jgi:hypothetical protein
MVRGYLLAVAGGIAAMCLVGLTSVLTDYLQPLRSAPTIAWGHGYMAKTYDSRVRRSTKRFHCIVCKPSFFALHESQVSELAPDLSTLDHASETAHQAATVTIANEKRLDHAPADSPPATASSSASGNSSDNTHHVAPPVASPVANVLGSIPLLGGLLGGGNATGAPLPPGEVAVGTSHIFSPCGVSALSNAGM